MLEFSETILTNCIVHHVGNPLNDGKLELSNDPLVLTEEMQQTLKAFFLKHLKGTEENYQFHHESNLELNEVYSFANNIFEGASFVKNTCNISKHLYRQTRNHNIKDGDLFIAMFDDVIWGDGMISQALGIFKSEKKEFFIKPKHNEKGITLKLVEGINQNKLDKACLIINDSYRDGFHVFTYEQNGADTEYWRKDFLEIQVRNNNFQQTNNYITVCKDFVDEKLMSNPNVTRVEQINVLNRSVDYFKKNKEFKESEFVKEVFNDPELAQDFKLFKKEFQVEHNVELDKNFSVSIPAVKKQAKRMRSVVKLDKNFHIYIHGDESLIEQGAEKDGRKFYKIYFESES